VDTAGDAVTGGNEELREGITLIYRGVLDISLRGLVYNVSDNKALDSLVLRNAATAVVAGDVVHVATTVLRSACVSSLLGH
jgi:hypothetical protein